MAASPTIVLVTGGNKGLGRAIVKTLLESDAATYHVLMGSRSAEGGRAAAEELRAEVPGSASKVEVVQLDLASDESIERAVEYIGATHGRLDHLVNNAGTSPDIAHLRGEISLRTSFNRAFDTNVTGTHVLTTSLMPLLFRSADPRLVFVAGLSALNSAYKGPVYYPTPPQPAGWPKPKLTFEVIGYRCSKTALNMLFVDWRHKLAADPIKVWCAGPGMMLTDLGDAGPEFREAAARQGIAGPERAAGLMRDVLEGRRDGDAGKLISFDGEMEI